jgi:hypothetical protein
VKFCLIAAEWENIKVAVNHGAFIPPESTREVLMGYQNSLHWQRKRLLQEKAKFNKAANQLAQQDKH